MQQFYTGLAAQQVPQPPAPEPAPGPDTVPTEIPPPAQPDIPSPDPAPLPWRNPGDAPLPPRPTPTWAIPAIRRLRRCGASDSSGHGETAKPLPHSPV